MWSGLSRTMNKDNLQLSRGLSVADSSITNCPRWRGSLLLKKSPSVYSAFCQINFAFNVSLFFDKEKFDSSSHSHVIKKEASYISRFAVHSCCEQILSSETLPQCVIKIVLRTTVFEHRIPFSQNTTQRQNVIYIILTEFAVSPSASKAVNFKTCREIIQ